MEGIEKKRYIAFISYSRKDKNIADWLHSKLESYVLIDREKASQIFPFKGKYFRPVFLDTQDLHVEERPFSDRLMEALENTSYLIVLCSKNSAVSPFVEREINYFLETHENNWSRIVPLFVDEVQGAIPPAFEGTTIMTRHFPIYNTRLSKKSEANNYCFYQIISYILGVDFSEIYNRYEVDSNRQIKKKRRFLLYIIASLSFLLCAIIGMFILYSEQKNDALVRQQRLINFEKKVFPAAIVHGYDQNFLKPVINHLKSSPERFWLYILLPKNKDELTHQDRIRDFTFEAGIALGIDSLVYEILPIDRNDKKIGVRIMRVVKDNKLLNRVYIDFATTTTSFLNVAEYKKEHEEYKSMPIDSIIDEYSQEFVYQINEKYKSDSAYIRFYYDKQDLIKEIGKHLNDTDD